MLVLFKLLVFDLYYKMNDTYSENKILFTKIKMVRSLSVDVNTQRRNPAFFNLSNIIHNMQNNETTRLRWRRILETAGSRLVSDSIERKLKETSHVYREKMAFK